MFRNPLADAEWGNVPDSISGDREAIESELLEIDARLSELTHLRSEALSSAPLVQIGPDSWEPNADTAEIRAIDLEAEDLRDDERILRAQLEALDAQEEEQKRAQAALNRKGRAA